MGASDEAPQGPPAPGMRLLMDTCITHLFTRSAIAHVPSTAHERACVTLCNLTCTSSSTTNSSTWKLAGAGDWTAVQQSTERGMSGSMHVHVKA